jgi:uncharacterized membrane protein
MKWIFGFIGMYLGAIMAEWTGAIAGFVTGFIGGAVLQLSSRLVMLEQELRTLRENLLESRVDVREAVHPPQAAAGPGIIPESPADDEKQPVDEAKPAREVSPIPTVTKPEKEFVVPDYTGKVSAYIRDFFTTGNVVVKTGVIILFFGIAFLISYAVERNAFPPALRLVAIAAGGVVMAAVGWRLRHRKPGYALILQGGGLGILYLAVYAAGNIYSLISLPAGFIVMLLLVVMSGWLAWLQNAHSLAIFAATGGFLAPILNSTGQGSHVILFSYYVLLNAGIFGLAWFRAWRFLNWLGFVFTFVIASLWGYQYYQPGYFNTTQPFLILFFLFYVGISILFSLRQPPDLKGLVDGSLVFGTPLIGFTLQSALVGDFRYGEAWSAFIMGVFYLLLTFILGRMAALKLLAQAFLALGVIFLSLAVPFVLDGHWTAAVWALEGAGIYWAGIRQRKLLARMFGLLLQFGGAFIFLMATQSAEKATAILNSAYTGSVFIAVAGLFISHTLNRYKENLKEWEQSFHELLLAWGLLWWFGAGINEIDKYLPYQYEFNATVFFISVSVFILALLARYLDWRTAQFVPVFHLPVVALLVLISFAGDAGENPFYNYGYISWGTAIAVQYFLLWYHEQTWPPRLTGNCHTGTLWLAVFLAAWVIARFAGNIFTAGDLWTDIAWGLIPAITIFKLLWLMDKPLWPIRSYRQNYLYRGSIPLCIYLALWIIYACFQEANPAPLKYMPVVNPLDIAQLFSMVVIYEWLKDIKSGNIRNEFNVDVNRAMSILAALGFIWINSVIAHSVHFYANVGFDLYALLKSPVFQTAISITWTLLALGIMGYATWKVARKPWFAGAVLLAAVVLKLFIVDMEDSGTVEQIVSFITVGLLMLMIGYFSPLPPKEGKTSVE